MLDLGTVKPGSTIRIPFNTFGSDGQSLTMTNFTTADILSYKDGGTTDRASTNGYTATTDFDGKTGKQLAIIDLADNSTAGFWNAGSEYLIAIDAVTVNTQTTGGFVARFRIGYPGAILDTTIATLSSQTSFTLTSGPAEDDALNDSPLILHDVASGVQVAFGVVLDYTGATKTVTLAASPTFTIAAGDNISLFMPQVASTPPSVNVVSWLGTPVATPTTAGVPEVDVTFIAGQTASAAGAVTFPGTIASTTNITAGTITTVSTVTGFTPADIASIKAKTDPLTFTATNYLNVDVRYVNTVQVQGVGTPGNPWRPV